MTLWVTGGNGFIGRNLIGLLAGGGRAVYGLGHGAIDEAERRQLKLAEWINGEIDAPNLSALAERGGLPAAILHLAGGSSVGLSIQQPYEDFSRTVNSTARLLEWVRRSAPNCRLIVASSAAVYGARYSGSLPEEAEPWPVSPYGHHKLMMEQLCKSYAVCFGLQTTVVRLFSVYGAFLRKQLLWDMCLRLQRGERELVLGGTGGELRDWVDVRDVVKLLASLAERPQVEKFQVINGGCGVGTTVAEVADILTKSWGEQANVRFSGVVRPGDPFSLVADDKKVRALPFAWEIPLSRGIADYVRWFKDDTR
jgi:UDP-glucose 4-epimerase